MRAIGIDRPTPRREPRLDTLQLSAEALGTLADVVSRADPVQVAPARRLATLAQLLGPGDQPLGRRGVEIAAHGIHRRAPVDAGSTRSRASDFACERDQARARASSTFSASWWTTNT